MSFSDYLELEVLKWVTGQTNALGTAPTPWLALATAVSGDGASFTEVTGTNYARVNTAGNWAAPATGSVSNNATVSYAQAGNNWSGPITHAVIMDANAAGNILCVLALSASKTVNTNDTLQFTSGNLTVTLD